MSSSFFCAASTGTTESNRMQWRSFQQTNISKLNFASIRAGRTAGPASSTLVKLSLNCLIIHWLPPLLYLYLLRPQSSWAANSDKKYTELNGAALNVNKPSVTSRKTDFPKHKQRQKIKNCGYLFTNLLVIQKYVYSFLNFPKNGKQSDKWYTIDRTVTNMCQMLKCKKVEHCMREMRTDTTAAVPDVMLLKKSISIDSYR